MKTSELIRRLQEADPTGDLEVSVGNRDIHFVSRAPAYYDGPAQVMLRDETKTNCYDIVGVEMRGMGDKVCIRTHGIEDAIWCNADVPVTYDEGVLASDWEAFVEKTRAEARACDAKIDRSTAA